MPHGVSNPHPLALSEWTACWWVLARSNPEKSREWQDTIDLVAEYVGFGGEPRASFMPKSFRTTDNR